MKIINLKSSNIKRLKAIELQIDENQNVITISGRNAQGKSSVLDSIWYALGGKNAAQDKPIRDGEEKAEVELTIQSEKGGYIVKRTFTEKGSYLTVTNPEGAKYSNPQELLDFIVGNLSFDPLEFSRMDSKKQVAELTKIVGLDFSELDENKKKLTDERLLIGREQKSLGQISEEELQQAIKFRDLEEVSVTDLISKLETESGKRRSYETAQESIKLDLADISKFENEIKKLQDQIESAKKNIEANKLIADTEEDLDKLRISVSEADDINKNIRKAKETIALASKIEEKSSEYAGLTESIKGIDEEKTKQLSEAKLPIEGLTWDEDKVLFNGIPYNQISSAEQLKVSMAIAMAANPKLRMLIIKDGSLLDKENLKVIQEMTHDKDFQAWVEVVSDTDKVGIVIEDGEVKKIN